MATTCEPAALMKARGSVWEKTNTLEGTRDGGARAPAGQPSRVLHTFNPRRKRCPLIVTSGARELTVGTVALRSCRRVGPSGWVLIKQERQSATSQPGTATITHQEPEEGGGQIDRVTSWQQLRVQSSFKKHLLARCSYRPRC